MTNLQLHLTYLYFQLIVQQPKKNDPLRLLRWGDVHFHHNTVKMRVSQEKVQGMDFSSDEVNMTKGSGAGTTRGDGPHPESRPPQVQDAPATPPLPSVPLRPSLPPQSSIDHDPLF